MSKKLTKKGFTLIEVVLVLAIGGLIFLLAFIAFRQASINRRVTARRNDANRVVSEISNYAGDHNGAIPSGGTAGAAGTGGASGNFNQFVIDYLGGADFKDPQGKTYNIVTGTPAATDDLQYSPSTFCPGSSGTAGTKDFSVQLKLEKGVVCRDTSGSAS